MRSTAFTRARFVISAFFIAALAAGCAGGGSSPSPRSPGVSMTASPAAPSSPTAPTQQGHATFVVTWPTTTGATPASRSRIAPSIGSRRPAYLSPSTASITITVNSGTPIVVNNPNIANSGESPSPTTTQIVNAPVGNDTFSVGDYDATGGTGALLATNSISYTIVVDQANVVPITLNGVLAKIACAAVAPYTSGTAPAFTIVGPAGEISIEPEDADSNIIVAPGVSRSITLTAADASKANVTSTATTNAFVVNPLAVGTVTLNAHTTDDGPSVTTACMATRVLAMYVANHYEDNQGNSSAPGAPFDPSASVTVYPVTATGSATPTATIQGANTLLSAVYFPLVDNSGDVFVSNQGPMPGQAFGITTGYVSIYGPATHDNTAPIGTIPNLGEPQGLAFDATGNLYVSEVDRIEKYPPSANGVGAAAVPSSASTIIGSNTDLGCYGIAVDKSGGLYLPCAVAMLYFPPGSTGNAAAGILGPLGTVVAGSTTLTTTQSWMGVAIDPTSQDFSLPGFNNNADEVSIYTPADLPTPGAGFQTPIPTLSKSVDYNQPFGIAVDPNGQYYVTNFGNSTVEVFTSETTLDAGLGTNLTLTGLNKPYGITVR